MKKLILIGAGVLFAYIASAQEIRVSDCSPYMELKQAGNWAIEYYTAKDKLTGSSKTEVLDVNGGVNDVSAVLKTTNYNKNGEETMVQEMGFNCKNGILEMDMSKHIPSEIFQSFEGTQIDMDVENVSYPKTLSVGQKLNDGSVKVKIHSGLTINLNVFLTDRKVESKENVQVPAGNYEAYKISGIIKTTGLIRSEKKVVEFIAEKVGVVRTELYKKNGKLESYSVLKEYN